MNKIQWLLLLANKRPLLFSLALLLIITMTLAYVVKYQEIKSVNCEVRIQKVEEEHRVRFDSLGNYYRKRELIHNQEVNDAYRSVIESYKIQLEEQKKINVSTLDIINKLKK